MDLDLLIKHGFFVLVLVVTWRTPDSEGWTPFGNFLKKVLGVLPISKMTEAIR